MIGPVVGPWFGPVVGRSGPKSVCDVCDLAQPLGTGKLGKHSIRAETQVWGYLGNYARAYVPGSTSCGDICPGPDVGTGSCADSV